MPKPPNDGAAWPIELREADEDDQRFWAGTWEDTYRNSRWAGTIPNHLYRDVQRVAMRQLTARPGTRVTLAHAPGDPDALLGYVVHERLPDDSPVVHYLYVKDPFREGRIATQLLLGTVGRRFRYTHRTDAARRFSKPGWEVSYEPGIARRIG